MKYRIFYAVCVSGDRGFTSALESRVNSWIEEMSKSGTLEIHASNDSVSDTRTYGSTMVHTMTIRYTHTPFTLH